MLQTMAGQFGSGDAEGVFQWLMGLGAGIFVFILLLMAVILAAWWKLFEKAGKPGALALVLLIPVVGPFIFLYHVLQIVGRPAWWIILFLVPLVNLVIGVIVNIDLAKAFGKGVGFAIGLTLLPFIFLPVLGFGSARYEGAQPVAVEGVQPA